MNEMEACCFEELQEELVCALECKLKCMLKCHKEGKFHMECELTHLNEMVNLARQIKELICCEMDMDEEL